MAESIRLAGETGKIGYDWEAFALVGEKTGFRLQDAYERYMKFPPARRSLVLQTFTRTWFALRRPLPGVVSQGPRTRCAAQCPRKGVLRLESWLRLAAGRKCTHLQLDDNHAVGLVYDFPEITVDIDEAIL